jgi:hypothetical protein
MCLRVVYNLRLYTNSTLLNTVNPNLDMNECCLHQLNLLLNIPESCNLNLIKKIIHH